MCYTFTVDATSIAWSDVELRGVAWVEEGRDVVFRVRLPGTGPAPERERIVICRWAEGLVLNVTIPSGVGGPPLTWNATFARRDDDRWSVNFDFAHAGEIRLTCAEVDVQPAP